MSGPPRRTTTRRTTTRRSVPRRPATRRPFPRRPGEGRDDAGLTLVELTVAMAIVSIIAAVVGSVTVSTLDAVRTATTRTRNAADARVAMETVSRTLRVAVSPDPTRGAPAVADARADAITFYALLGRGGNTDPAPTLVEYYRDAATGCLVQATTPARVVTPTPTNAPPWAWDTGRTAACVVRTSQLPSVSDPWFSYYKTSLLSAGGTPVAPVAMTESGLALTDRQDVVSVEFTLSVTDPAAPTVGAVRDQVRVTLGNYALGMGGLA